MQIQVKEIEPCRLLINYEADAQQILDKRADVLRHFQKAPVPGFRKGKATPDAIRHHYKDQIEESLKRAMAEDAYHNTIFEKKLKAHGAPKITSALLVGGKFVCEFEMFIKPDFTLAPFKDQEVIRPAETSSTLELTEKMLQDLRIRLGTTEPFSENDIIQTGDNVILDYEGSIDGEKIDSLCAVGETLTVGNSLLKDFDSNLLGMKIGEIRNFNLIVPETGLPSLANKTITFQVTLVIGSKTVPCPLDDELAQRAGKKDLVELRQFISGIAMAKNQETNKQLLLQALSAKLVADNEINVPNWILLSEAQYLAQQSKLDWNLIEDKDKELYIKLAEKNTKLTLILDRIREDEPEAQLSDQEIFEMIKQKIVESNTQDSVDDVIQNMNKTGYLQILFSRIKDEYTLDFVIKSTKIIE